MRKRISRIFGVIIICGIAACLSGSIVETNYGANLEEEKKKQEAMQKELKDVQSLIKELQGMKGNTEEYIQALDVRMSALSDNVYNLKASIEDKKLEIENTKASIVLAQEEIDRQYEAMKLRIQYMYENGENSYLTMIFDSKSMADMMNRAEYLNQITAYDREQLVRFEMAKANLDAKELKLEAEEKDLEATLAEIEAEQLATEQLIVAKQELLDEYNSNINGAEDKMYDLEDDIEAQKAIVAELEEIERRRKEQEKLNSLNKVSYDGGTMTWPVPGRSYISSDFGYRKDPFGGPTTEYHSGIDIPAPLGTQIVAAYDGQVAWSYRSSSAGNWVGIDHGDGIFTVYMHMSKRLVSEGDWVKKGEVIGLVGSTGRSTGNHLHFSVRKDGQYVNPHNWVTP